MTVDFRIYSILDISEANSYVELAFELTLSWADPRLLFYNLKDQIDLNVLTQEEKSRVWTPVLIFENTRDKSSTIEDEKRKGFVKKMGTSKYAEMDESNVNKEIFEGAENDVIMKRIYNMQFLCDFKLGMYPFDKQECTARISVDSSQILFVEMALGGFVYKGPVDLQQYFVIKSSMGKRIYSNGLSQLVVKMSFGRKLMNSVLTIYMPTILLLCVVHATNYFKDFFFEAVVTVNLTGMLVLTTIFMSVSANLPQTSYVKMIDVWLLFCVLIPFFEVLLHTWMDSQRMEKRDVNHHGTVREVSAGAKKISPQTSGRQSDLVSRRENVQVEALRKFYQEEVTSKKNLEFGEILGKKVIPFTMIVFSFIYWIYGLRNHFS